MKNLILILILFFVPLSLFAQSTKMYAKVVAADELPNLSKLPRNFEIVFIEGSRAIIEVTITTSVGLNMLNNLEIAGRYHINHQDLTFPNLDKAIIVNNEKINESVKVKIYVPKT